MTGPRVAEAADLVVRTTLERRPTLGAARLVCIDGPAGSGKSTLGTAVPAAVAGSCSTAVLHVDDLLDGWDGLVEAGETLHRGVLLPLRQGRPGRYRRYDWHLGRFAEEVTVDPVDLLVVEGVGSWRASYSSLVTALVWVHAPSDLRLTRGLARDGEALRSRWEAWMRAEQDLFHAERTRAHADVVVDGTGGRPPLLLPEGSQRREAPPTPPPNTIDRPRT